MDTPRTKPLRMAAGLLALVCLTCLPGCGLMDPAAIGSGILSLTVPALLFCLIPIGMAARNFFEFRDDFFGDRTQARGDAAGFT